MFSIPIAHFSRKRRFNPVSVDHWRNRAFRWLASVALLFQVTGAFAANTPVTFQLRWLHQFQFAGYYAALHKGFYQDSGLDVTLKEGGPDISAIDEVLQGRAQFGVSTSGLVKAYMSGKPVLMLAPIIQHSPLILLSLGNKPGNPAEVAKAGIISLQPGDESLELKAMFVNEGIPLDKLKITTENRGLEDLLAGRIVAMNAYLSNEPFWLQQRGIPYTVLKPDHYGMDFYSDVLFTSRTTEKAQPETVAAFRAATLKGWDYALVHHDEIIDLILERYNTQGKSRAHLQFEAKILKNLINPDVIQIGHSNPGRWKHIAETYERFGVVKANKELKDFFYEPNRKVDLTWYYLYLAIALAVLVVVGGIAFYIHRINRRLDTKVMERTAELEKAYLELKELDQLKSDFLSTVSHELRTPMTSVVGFAKLVKKKLENSIFPRVSEDDKTASVISQVSENLDIIIGESERLTLLINDVLDSSKLEAGKVEWNLVTVAPQRLIERGTAITATLAEHKGLELISEVEPNLSEVIGDENRLLQVLTNLIANAVKFTAHGQIAVRADRQDRFVRFSVRDSGIGIAEENWGKVFDKFRQVGGTLTDKPQGTGLGLSICQQIVKHHGGRIWLDSTPGVGSTFYFTVPIIEVSHSTT